MSIIESTATALVRFTGLGIVCFNQVKQRAEIAVIRDEQHELSVKVQQPRFKDGIEKDIIVYEDIAVYQLLPKTGVEIEIKAGGDAAIAGYEIYQADGEFDRLTSDDANDFRWIVGMTNLHGEMLVKSADENRYPVSKLSVANGLFYAHKLDTDLFFEKVEKDASGTEANREAFGNVAETIGVKIEADTVNFNIKIGDETHSHPLERVSGLPFRIEISNMNTDENAVMSDMPDYYKYLSSPSGVTFELEPVRENDDDGVSGGPVSGSMFCHPVDGGGACFSVEDFQA
jgi:hypothetical protein